MVGLYPDPPGHRMDYDQDGTVPFAYNGTTVTVLTQAQRETMNSEPQSNINAAPASSHTIGLIFPELRDITHIGFKHLGGSNFTVQHSINTTNGIDGTWTTVAGTWAHFVDHTRESYRSTWRAIPLSAVKAIRVVSTGSGGTWGGSNGPLHVYGKVTAPNKHLQFWQDVADARVTPAWFDLGDIELGSTNTRSFRIKNRSATLTANGVVVDAEALTDSTPNYDDTWVFSDGGAFATSVTIPSIAPGAISGVITAQLVPNSATSVWYQRFTATATTWT